MKKTTQSTLNPGRVGEEAAVRHLKKQGYQILSRNFRKAFAEVDIVARDGETLVFIEVKTRSSLQFGAPVEEVDPDTGEVTITARPVLPSHFKCPQSGLCLQVENPAVWVYPDGLEDDLTHMSEA